MSVDRLREMLAASTPGPWTAVPSKGTHTRVDVDGYSIAHAVTRENARLIALAPDAIALLADMGEVLEWAIRMWGDEQQRNAPDREDARKLLSRLDALCGDDHV